MIGERPLAREFNISQKKTPSIVRSLTPVGAPGRFPVVFLDTDRGLFLDTGRCPGANPGGGPRIMSVPGATNRSSPGTGGFPGATPGGASRIITVAGAASSSIPDTGGFPGATPGGGSRIVTVPEAASRPRPGTSGFPGATLGGGP